MKIYKDMNVFDATMERIKFAFENFDNIYVSFSGGKDSGLLLNMVRPEPRLFHTNRQ